jgi:hypothetical protein
VSVRADVTRRWRAPEQSGEAGMTLGDAAQFQPLSAIHDLGATRSMHWEVAEYHRTQAARLSKR